MKNEEIVNFLSKNIDSKVLLEQMIPYIMLQHKNNCDYYREYQVYDCNCGLRKIFVNSVLMDFTLENILYAILENVK